jgi:hypothetical protein
VHERVDVGRDEAVVDEEVFLDAKRGVVTLEIAGMVIGDAMTHRQVLGPRRSPDRIGLDEAEALQRAFEGSWREEAAGNRKTPEIVATDHFWLAISTA